MAESLKLSFGFDTSALAAYVNQENLTLYTKALMKSTTMQYLSAQVQTGIKYKEQINYMDVDVNLREKTSCTLTSSGSVTFTKKELQVYPFYDQQNFCPSQLETFYTQKFLPAGSTYENMPVEQAYATYYAEKIASKIEVDIWQSTSSSASKIVGLNYIIDNTAGVINGNPTSIAVGTGITTGNVIGIFTGMVNLIPSHLAGRQDLEFVCGWDTFRKLLQAYFTLNNFHYGSTEEGNPYGTGEILIPTFGLKVKAVGGLDTTNRIHLTYKDNYRIGTDMQNEYESIDLWYERKDNQMYSRIIGKLGTQILFGEDLITFKLVP